MRVIGASQTSLATYPLKNPLWKLLFIAIYLRTGDIFQASNPAETIVERNYIRDETKKIFRMNKPITASTEIQERVREAEARLAMAEHYRNPYPRPVNLPPGSYSVREGKKLGRAIDKKNRLSKPVYVKSIDDTLKR